MAATGQEAVTLAQLKTAMGNSGSGGSNCHVFELTASTPSFTFEKSGIGFTRWKNDFTVVAVDSEYGVGVLGVFQNGSSSGSVTVATVTGGADVTRNCYYVETASGGIGNIKYNGEAIILSSMQITVYAGISLWIDKA